MQAKNGYYHWMVYGLCLLCLLFSAGCTSNISNCPAFSGFVGKTFVLNKAQYLWQDQTSESVYEITNIGKKPVRENMKILTTLPVGTSLHVEKVQRTVGLLGYPWDYAKVQRTVGLLGYPWDYAIVQVVVSARNPKKVTAKKLLNYDYETPFGGHQAVIHSKEGTGIPCINR